MDAQTRKFRLAMLRDILTARTTPEGHPKPGYKANVAAIKAEIAKLLKEHENETRPA